MPFFVLALSTFGAAQVLIETDFESSQGYPIGPLAGLSSPSWGDTSGFNAFLVQQNEASMGSQAIGVNTGPIGSNRAYRPIPAEAIGSGNSIIVASVLGRAAGGPEGFVSSYVGLDAYQENPRTRFAVVRFRPTLGQSNGSVEIISDDVQYVASVPMPEAGQWYRLIMMLDTTTGKIAGNWNQHELFVTNPIQASDQYHPPVSRVADFGLYAGATGYNWLYYDDLKVEAMRPGTIEGEVQLLSWYGTVEGVEVQVEVRTASGMVLDTQRTTLDARGRFRIVTNVRGQVFIAAKPSHWLSDAYDQPVNLTNFGVHHLTFSTINGDCSDDNFVEIGDYAIISYSLFSTVGTPFWDARGDLNGDDWVDITDYSILSSNYSLAGE